METAIKINDKKALNRKAKKELEIETCHKLPLISDITAYGFTGYINSNEYENITLTLKNKKWYFVDSVYNRRFDCWENVDSVVIALSGTIDFFSVHLECF